MAIRGKALGAFAQASFALSHSYIELSVRVARVQRLRFSHVAYRTFGGTMVQTKARFHVPDIKRSDGFVGNDEIYHRIPEAHQG